MKGVDPYSHAAIYSSSEQGPKYLKNEDRSLQKKPIKIELSNPKYKLDPASRLNYVKTYKVEHNVKVLFIGRVSPKYEKTLYTNWKEYFPNFMPTTRDERPINKPIEPRPETPPASASHPGLLPRPGPSPNPDDPYPPSQGRDFYDPVYPRDDDLYN